MATDGEEGVGFEATVVRDASALRIYQRMFPHLLDAEGFPKSSEVSHKPQTKLSSYNGSEIKQHGDINLLCQYTDSSWQTLAFYM
jgi:hypothetical protein